MRRVIFFQYLSCVLLFRREQVGPVFLSDHCIVGYYKALKIPITQVEELCSEAISFPESLLREAAFLVEFHSRQICLQHCSKLVLFLCYQDPHFM